MTDPPSFLQHVKDWAATHTDILAVCLVGSHARGAATDASDIDLVIVTETPDLFLDEHGWLREFGDTLSIEREDMGLIQSLRTRYEDGKEVEFRITTPAWAQEQGAQDTAADGMRVLLDTRKIFSQLVR